jgi:transcriptional regulator with XRE-family HTH domain
MKNLAERLAAARAEKELSQQELAKRADVAQSTIAGLESGARLTARRITAIADALGVSVSWLAEGKGPRERMAVAQSNPPGPERALARRLQWVEDDEADMLSLYRALAQDAKGTALVVLQSLPKAISDERGGLDQR